MESASNDSRGNSVSLPETRQAMRLIFKRGMDVAGAGLALVLLSPLLILIAVLIRVTEGGPVLFSQLRIGRSGMEFRMLKFCTMRAECSGLAPSISPDGQIDKRADDWRITRIGRLLRRSSLDELPQLINVLRGEMSLVGPRPLPEGMLIADSESLALRCWLRPGMTGLWQVRNRAANRSIRDMLPYDLDYASKVSIRRDALILMHTIAVVIRGTGAI